jgi:hypothetical protein
MKKTTKSYVGFDCLMKLTVKSSFLLGFYAEQLDRTYRLSEEYLASILKAKE